MGETKKPNDTQFKLGKLLDGPEPRDAVHIAVVSVVAAHVLNPGTHIGLSGGGTAGARVETPIGVVDPFLEAPVRKGQRFWMFLYPNSITTLRHHWSHPAFGDEDAEPQTISIDAHKAKSEAWLRAHAERLGLSMGAVMRDAERWIESGDYTVQQGSEEWRDDFGKAKDYWHHYEIFTGKKVEDHEATFYCCTC